MNTNWKDVARTTLKGSEDGTMAFAQSVKMLTETGFDSYAVDFRRAVRTYYRPDGESVELEIEKPHESVAARFDAATIKDALREAQELVPGYTYKGFCGKVVAAGCAGYMVSLIGKRVLYFGRTGETHTEYFPGTQP